MKGMYTYPAIKPIVIGTHQYEWAVNVFSWLFDKYWHGQTVTYIGDTLQDTLYGNVDFMQVPCFSEGDWPWEHWFGQGLRSIFEVTVDSLVALFLPDHWLYAEVDFEKIASLGRYMEAHKDIIRGCITANQPLYSYGCVIDVWEGNDIWCVPHGPNITFERGLTFCPSLWNPKLALEILEDDWTLWQCESLGTEKMRSERQELYSVGISPAPVHRAHTLRHRYNHTITLADVAEEDRNVVYWFAPQGWTIVQ